MFQKFSGMDQNLWMRDEGVSRFSVENFLPHSAEKFRGGTEPFNVSKKMWCRKFACIGEGGIRVLLKKVLSHRTEKLRKGFLLCQKFSSKKKNYG